MTKRLIGLGNDNYQNILLNSGEDIWNDPNDPSTGNGIDDDNNGLIDDWKGWNYANNSNDVRTPNAHGTLVAGIVSAKSNNSIGISGLAGGNNADGVNILPYCIGVNAPIGALIDDAIIDAVDNGARVIQMSLNVPPSSAIDISIQYAIDNNVIVICASGNAGTAVQYPASNNNVISVGGTDQNDLRANFSNFGNNLDIVAPGVGIRSTNLMNTYATQDGTSFAAPQVSAVAALILSVNPNLTAQQVRNIIESTAQKVGGYAYTNTSGRPNGTWDDEMGYGLVDAFAAVQAAMPQPVITGASLVCTSPNQTYTLTNAVGSVTWQVSNNLQIISSSNTNITVSPISVYSGGAGFVKAIMAGTTVQKDVWIGIPSVPSSILGFCCNGKEFGSESIYEFTVRANNQGVNQFNWLVAGGTILEGQGTNTIIVKTAKVTGSNKVYFDVSARVGNSCGWSSYLWRSGYVTSGVGPAIFSVYPNPADNEVTISVADIQAISETDAINEVISAGEVKIYDFFGTIKKVKKTNSDQKSITINVSDLQKGTYLILINRGTITESHKLIIE